MKKAAILSFFGLLVSTSIWGSTFFIIKDSLNQINPITLVAYRFSLAAIVFAIIVFVKREKFLSHLSHGIILGIFVWLIFIFQTLGLKYTTASNSGFISGLFIVFVPLFEWLFFKNLPKVMHSIAVCITIVGLWFLTGGLKGITIGDVLTLVTAVSIGLEILVLKKIVTEKKSVVVLGFQQFLTTAMLSFMTILIFHLPLFVGGSGTMISIIYLALFGSALSQGLLLACQKNLPALTVSLLLSTEPVFAALFAWTLGHEVFIPSRASGGLLILVAIILVELPLNTRILKISNWIGEK